MPRQGGAFYARRKLRHPGERRQAPQVIRAEPARLAGDEAVKDVEEAAGLFRCLSLDRRAHHRCGGLGDGAAVAGKTDVADHAAVEIDVDGVMVAAERVIALDFARAVAVDLAEI